MSWVTECFSLISKQIIHVWGGGGKGLPSSAYLSVLVGEGDSEVGHGPQDGDEGLDGVAVDHRAVLLEVLRGEATLVDDSARGEGEVEASVRDENWGGGGETDFRRNGGKHHQ